MSFAFTSKCFNEDPFPETKDQRSTEATEMFTDFRSQTHKSLKPNYAA